jgi:hypothetical protein
MARGRTDDDGADRRGVRGVILLLGVVMAAVATGFLVVTEDPKLLRLGIVGALWAFVLAAIAVPRRRRDDGDSNRTRELELRRTYELELEREVAARREYEMQLEVYLRRELDRGVREEVESLRQEVQALRGDVIERLDGELRMERIETTRLIGGSLRALREEARRLGITFGDLGDDARRFDEEPARELAPSSQPPERRENGGYLPDRAGPPEYANGSGEQAERPHPSGLVSEQVYRTYAGTEGGRDGEDSAYNLAPPADLPPPPAPGPPGPPPGGFRGQPGPASEPPPPQREPAGYPAAAGGTVFPLNDDGYADTGYDSYPGGPEPGTEPGGYPAGGEPAYPDAPEPTGYPGDYAGGYQAPYPGDPVGYAAASYPGGPDPGHDQGGYPPDPGQSGDYYGQPAGYPPAPEQDRWSGVPGGPPPQGGPAEPWLPEQQSPPRPRTPYDIPDTGRPDPRAGGPSGVPYGSQPPSPFRGQAGPTPVYPGAQPPAPPPAGPGVDEYGRPRGDDELDRILTGTPPPAPRAGPDSDEDTGRRRRYRDEDEPNEVLSRLLGRE